MLTIGNIVWGARDIHRLRDFWTEALHYRQRDDDEIVDWVTLVPREGDGPNFALMLVGSDGPRRHHLDLYADNAPAEIARLIDLGATRVNDWDYEPDADYTVLADPDGNTFCIVQT